MSKNTIKIQACFEMTTLVISLFAFAFLIGGYQKVEAQVLFPVSNMCCEKTIEGAWCQNTLEENCNVETDSLTGAPFKSAPTNCESTSFCKQGCCFDSAEGLCMENTPQRVCEEEGGIWGDDPQCNVPQCNLGCCVIGDQASFVTLTRCKRLSSFYGLNTDFRTNVDNEVSCISLAQAEDEGACVFESEEYERTCQFTTRAICNGIDGASFHNEHLCSDSDLATNCGMSKRTICLEGSDAVYFQDTCGNPANVYDASRVEDESYWTLVIPKSESCILSGSLGNSESCGNCDYFGGSICAEGDATYGDLACQDLNCYDVEYAGHLTDFKNGESWCSYDGFLGAGRDTVGSRQFRYICLGGEVILEPCADFRNEWCLEDTVDTSEGEFREAQCIVNRWQDCVLQEKEEDCVNTDKRDCFWMEDVSFTIKEGQVLNLNYGGKGACVPDIPPGGEFWNSQTESTCALANAECKITTTEDGFGGEETENEVCLTDEWAEKMNEVCAAMGDCGAYINYKGTYNDDGVIWTVDGNEKEFSNLEGSMRSYAGISALVLGMRQSIIASWFNQWGLSIGVGMVSGQEESTALVHPGTSNLPVAGGVPAIPKINSAIKTFNNPQTVSLITSLETSLDSAELMDISVTGYKEVLVNDEIGIQLLNGKEQVGEAFLKSNVPEGVNLNDVKTSTWNSPISASWMSGIVQGATWGLFLFGAGQVIGMVAGMEGKETMALSAGLGAAGFVSGILNNLPSGNLAITGKGATLGTTTWNLGISAAVGILVYLLLYEKSSEDIVTFECKPWQPPMGGDNCKACDEKGKPCSEYRCKSLGQACELLNPGSDSETCEWINPTDVISPTIKIRHVSEGHKSIPDPSVSKVDNGVKISQDNGDCLEAYTPLEFILETFDEDGKPEATQCKIDKNLTLGEDAFERMTYYVGGSNLFTYNHTERLSLPGPDVINAQNPVIESDGTFTFYTRCSDANGNYNREGFSVRFCVNPGPDTTPARIMDFDLASGAPVTFGTSELDLSIYTNEPADCRWSITDWDYENMEHEMSCSNKIYDMNANFYYPCTTTLTGIADMTDNVYYMRCKDQPDAENEADRNVNVESTEYIIVGTQALNILDAQPNDKTIKDSRDVVPVTLEVVTDNGFYNGESICSYSTTPNELDYIAFFVNEGFNHEQVLTLIEGEYLYYLKCVDLGGNAAYTNISFEIDVDRTAPVVVRAYQSGNKLRILTDEESTCSYSTTDCNFDIDDGINLPLDNQKGHAVAWDVDELYYIRCKDQYNNQPDPNRCSIEVSGYEIVGV